MALFESYERRIDQINSVLNSYGIASIEEAEKITKDAGLDVYNQIKGIQANREKMKENLNRSLMLVTAIAPYIGYENAAKTAKKAYKENISLKEACVKLGFMDANRFDEVFHPEEMV